MKMRKINKKTFDLIRRFEGLRLKAYRDAAGVWTIGYGHTSMAGAPKVTPGMRITREEAERILREDVQRFAHQVAKVLGPDVMSRLNDNQFGALVSFAFNVGIGNFKRSSVLRAVREGRFDDVPRLLMRWTKAGGRRLRGLVRRRRAEGRLWLTPPDRRRPPPMAVARQRAREIAERPGLAAAWAAFLVAAANLAVAVWQQAVLPAVLVLDGVMLAIAAGWVIWRLAQREEETVDA